MPGVQVDIIGHVHEHIDNLIALLEGIDEVSTDHLIKFIINECSQLLARMKQLV